MGRCYVRSVKSKWAGGRDKTENEEGHRMHVILPESQVVSFTLAFKCGVSYDNENESYNDNNLAHMFVV